MDETCKNCVLLNDKVKQLTIERDEALTKLNQYKAKEDKSDVSQIVNDLKEMKLEVKKVLENAKECGETITKFRQATDENFAVVKDIIKDTQKSSHVMEKKVDKIEENTRFRGILPFEASTENISVMDEVGCEVQAPVKDVLDSNVIYLVAPDSSGILIAGDRILDSIPTFMVDYLYDLMGQAIFNTSPVARVREFFVGSTKGVKLVTEKERKIELIILSFGRDDLVEHTDFIRQSEVSDGMDLEEVLKINLDVAKSVSETIQLVLNKIAAAFGEVKIVYILPPPSKMNSNTTEIFEKFRCLIREMPNMPENLEMFDMDSIVKDDDFKEMENEKGPGVINWKATRKVVRELYKSQIGPKFEGKFCDDCFGCHPFGACPTLEMKSIGQLDRNGCHICYKNGHKARDCLMWEVLKSVHTCPHCGSVPGGNRGYVNHNPDLCKSRFLWCQVCQSRGHETKVHENPAALRAVRERIGNNLKVCDKTIASKSVGWKKRPGIFANEEPQKKISKEKN